MSGYAMTVDTRLCVACKACVLACNAENRVPLGYSRTWLVEVTQGWFPAMNSGAERPKNVGEVNPEGSPSRAPWRPKLTAENRSERCNHCDNAPCVRACPTGASHVGDGGVVLVDRGKCTGCKACIAACPYDARYVHPEGYTDKCTLCAHRLAEGRDPACVATCPTRTLTVDTQEALARVLAGRHWHTLHPAAGTRPKIFFLS